MRIDIFTTLPFMACLFWLMVYMLDWRRNSPARHLLTVFMGVCTLLYLCHAVFFNATGTIADVADSTYVVCNLSIFPLYYLYIRRLTDTQPIRARQLWILLPALLLGCVLATTRFFPGASAQSAGVVMHIVRLTFAVQVVLVAIYGYRRLRRFNTLIDDYFSNNEQRNVRPAERIILVLALGTVFAMGANYIGRDFFSDNSALISLPSLVFTALLFAVGYEGQRQSFSVDDMVSEVQDEAEAIDLAKPAVDAANDDCETSHEATATINRDLLARIERLMEEQRPYLNSDLRLSDVAKELGVGRTVLSNFFNQSLNTSFSAYINTLRVEHAKRMMAEDNSRRLTMVEISEHSGFSTESSLYRAFRKITGMTPKQWIAQAEQ